MRHVNETEWNAYMAGTCDPENAEWIDLHVKECPQCRGRMQSIGHLEEILGQWQVNPAGHDVSERVRQIVLKEAGRSASRLRFHRRIVSYALRAAALLLIGTTLGYLAGKQSAQQYIAQQQGDAAELQPGYLAAIDLQFASGLTWSVLSDVPSDAGGQ